MSMDREHVDSLQWGDAVEGMRLLHLAEKWKQAHEDLVGRERVTLLQQVTQGGGGHGIRHGAVPPAGLSGSVGTFEEWTSASRRRREIAFFVSLSSSVAISRKSSEMPTLLAHARAARSVSSPISGSTVPRSRST